MDNQIQTHDQGDLITGVPEHLRAILPTDVVPDQVDHDELIDGVPEHLRQYLPKDVVARDSGRVAVNGTGGELSTYREGGRSGTGITSTPKSEFKGDPTRVIGHPSNPDTIIINNP